MFNSIKAIIAAIAVALLSTGCASNLPQVSKNYHFPPPSNEGLVAFTVSCNLAEGKTTLNILPVDTSASPELSYSTSIQCNMAGANLNQPQLKIIALPVGKYYLDSWVSTNGDIMGSVMPVYFNAIPNKINYIGWLRLIDGYDDTYKSEVRNASRRDIGLIKNYFSNVSSQDIVMQAYVKKS